MHCQPVMKSKWTSTGELYMLRLQATSALCGASIHVQHCRPMVFKIAFASEVYCCIFVV